MYATKLFSLASSALREVRNRFAADRLPAEWTAILRRNTLAMLASAFATLPGWASAQSILPLQIIVPYGAGSAADLFARQVGEELKIILKRPVVIINRSGAGGMIGAQSALTAPKDGNTVLWAASSLFGTNPFVFRKLPYALDQFEPVSNVIEACFAVVSHPSSGFKSIGQLIARMKARPGELNFASPGIGNQLVLTWEALAQRAGVQAHTVSYKTSAEAMLAIIAGQVDVTVLPVDGANLASFKSGRTVPLAVTCRERIPQFPEVQTMAEAGYPELTIYGAYQAHYTKGVPSEMVERLAQAIEQVKHDAAFVKNLQQISARPATAATPAEFGQWLDADRKLWSRIARETNVMIEN